MQRPVVLQAITRLNIGGPARHVLDIAAGLPDRYDIRVAAGWAPEHEGETPANGVDVRRLPLARPIDPRLDGRATVAMRRLLVQENVTVLHTHMAKAGAVGRVAAASLGRGRPKTVHTFHGHVLSGYFTGRTERVFTQVERRLARRTDVLIAVSDEIRDALLHLRIGRPDQYLVVTPGIDLEPYLAVDGAHGTFRHSLGLPRSVGLVAVVARLAPIKDHQTLLEAMVTLPDVHVALVGDGELRAPLQDLTATLGLTGRVHFTGWRTDLPAVLADADVVALTSRNEGTPLALIEAAAAARPIVATDVGGVRRIVDHGRTGLLVPAGDSQAVADAIDRMLRDPVLSGEFGRRARRHVREGFGRAVVNKKVGEIYDSILRSP